MNMLDFCETGRTVYSPYPKILESLTICGYHYKRQHFLLSYPEYWSGQNRTHDLPHGSLLIVCPTLCHFGSRSQRFEFLLLILFRRYGRLCNKLNDARILAGPHNDLLVHR